MSADELTTPIHSPHEVAGPRNQSDATPDHVVRWLKEGNERFVEGRRADRDLLAHAAATATVQHPLAAVLGCIDSRVPVEVVLDLGIGDVFVARTGGHVVDDVVLGSLEFATAVTGSKVILVLGHDNCGAVLGACDGVELGHLTGVLSRITPVIEEVSGSKTPGSDDAVLVARIVERHVRDVTTQLAERSEVLADLLRAGDLAIVGAIYDMATGRIRWLD